MAYIDIYQRRLNRYGNDYTSRIQGEREKLFDKLLQKTIYKVDFAYNNQTHEGSFERYKQDETETLHYLLTRTNLVIPNGTILQLPNQFNELHPWMVYYLENIKASGYNKYIMLRMTHYLTWTSKDGSTHSSWAYMYGQEDNMLHDELKSRSRVDTIYDENLKSSFFILPLNEFIERDLYLEVGQEPFIESYRVTGYDIQSSEGVEYVTVDPIYKYDLTPPPTPTSEDDSDEFYWFKGGTE